MINQLLENSVKERGTFSASTIADLRTNHAGETGAVFIYRGILAFSRDKTVRQFASEHMRTEKQHLDLMATLLNPDQQSKLLTLWRFAGWLTGAVSALMGSNAVFATIQHVETFVDHHYQQQIDGLSATGKYPNLKAVLAWCQADEIAHRDEAREKQKKDGSSSRIWGLKAWLWMIQAGSGTAVAIARRL